MFIFRRLGDKIFGRNHICCRKPSVSQKYNTSLEKELTRLLVHGILHLSGFDHEQSKLKEKKMFKLQEEIIKKICSISARWFAVLVTLSKGLV